MSSHLRLTSEERTRRAYVARVRKLLQETFNLSGREMVCQDLIWEKWCSERRALEIAGHYDGSRGNEYRCLHQLLRNPEVKDCFKVRVLAVLLVPRIDFAPFRYQSQFPLQNYLEDCFSFGSFSLNVAELSPKLRWFAAWLLEINFEVFGWVRPEASKRFVFPKETYEEYYQKLILQLLEVLPEESAEAERLFDRYVMEWHVQATYEDKRFKELLEAPIPISWKLAADMERRTVILKKKPEGEYVYDASAEADAASDWNLLVSGYASDTQFLLMYNFPHRVEMLASQVEWLLDLASEKMLPPIWWFDSFTRILSRLPKDGHGGLRHRFARHMLFSETPVLLAKTKKSPTVSDESDCRIVQELIDDLGESDQELVAKLWSMICDYRASYLTRKERYGGLRNAERAMC